MCAATAAAVGTAVAAAAAVGTQVAGAVSQGSSGGGGAATAAPRTAPVPGFAPATGMQTYTARLLAANRATKTPGLLEWAGSGGTLRPDWKIPDFTPKEAEQLQFVDKHGNPIPGYAPEEGGGLSLEAQKARGREKLQALKREGLDIPSDNPQINYARAAAREEMLQSRIAEKGAKPALEKKLAKATTRRTKLEGRL